MIETKEIKLSPIAQLKLELYREFDDDAEKIFDFIAKSESIFSSANKDADLSVQAKHCTHIAPTESDNNPDGVYLIYQSGAIEPFSGNNSKDGVAYVGVKMGERFIGIALKDLGNGKEFQFLKSGAKTEKNSPFYTTEKSINAFEDFDGEANTERLKTLDTEIPLDELKSIEHIPSLGELGIIMMNLTKVNEALVYVGGTPLKGWYWSSTETSQTGAWYVNFSDGGTYDYGKCNSSLVRAVAAFKNIRM